MSLRVAILSAVLLAISAPIRGTSLRKIEFRELVIQADRIVQGKVDAVEVRMDSRLRLPFTWVRLRVDDPLKGDRRQTIFLRHVGGKLPGSTNTLSVAGTPQFRVGDNVLVFLTRIRDESDTYQVLGMNQGKYRIVDETAIAQVTGVQLVDSRTGRVLPSGFTERAPLDSIKSRIRELMR
jgi:hypothetical protein